MGAIFTVFLCHTLECQYFLEGSFYVCLVSWFLLWVLLPWVLQDYNNQRIVLGMLPLPGHCTESRLFKSLNVRPRIIKLLEENRQ